jgi:hypothetical protein
MSIAIWVLVGLFGASLALHIPFAIKSSKEVNLCGREGWGDKVWDILASEYACDMTIIITYTVMLCIIPMLLATPGIFPKEGEIYNFIVGGILLFVYGNFFLQIVLIYILKSRIFMKLNLRDILQIVISIGILLYGLSIFTPNIF